MGGMIAHLRSPAVTLALLAAELGREAAARAALYRRKVDEARMTEAEAERGLALCAAWREDVERMTAAWGVGEPTRAPRHAFSWKERVDALQRELELRRRFYPEWIDAARLDRADADRRLQCAEALLWIYLDGWDWRASDGKTPMFSDQARQEWNAHQAAVDLARDPERQKEMALQ